MTNAPAVLDTGTPEHHLDDAQLKRQLNSLTPKQQAWVVAYRATLNATESARRAGYTGTHATLRTIGYKNRHHPNIDPLCRDAVRRRHMTTDEVMARLSATAESDLGNFLSALPDGRQVVDLAKGIESGHSAQLKKVKQKLTERRETTVVTYEDVEFEVADNVKQKLTERRETTVVTYEIETSVEVHDARQAQQTILRAHGAFKDGVKPPQTSLAVFFTTVQNGIMGTPANPSRNRITSWRGDEG